MANVKITELTALTDPASTDVLPIVDVVADATKKVTIADLLENAGAGSASAAAFAFDGDSDTGMYRPAANELGFTTGGTGRLFIDSLGNVGIGGTPSAQLNLIASVPTLRLTDSDTNGYSSLLQSDTSLYIDADRGATGTGALILRTNGANERMRIDSSGNVGIGVTSPLAIFHVKNDTVGGTLMYLQGTSSYNYEIRTLGGAHFENYIGSGGAVWSWNSGGTERMRIDSAGNVGIGTSSPAVSAHINSSTPESLRIQHPSSPYQTFYVGASRGAFILSNSSKLQIAAESASNNTITFQTSTTERMRIDSAGNVGIGGNGVGSGLGVYLQRTGNYNFYEASDGTKTMIAGVDSALDYVKIGSLSNHNLGFITDNTERMRIDSAGNVGIGTTTAQVPLHVGLGVVLDTPDGGGSTFNPQVFNSQTSGVAGLGVCVNDGSSNYRASLFADPGNNAWGLSQTYSTGTPNFVLVSGGSERMRIDSSGRLLVGTTTARSTSGFGSPRLQLVGDYESSILLTNTTNNTNSIGLTLSKIRGTSIVQNGDALGYIQFAGYDGDQDVAGAYIQANVDGTPGDNDMPTRLVFSTTADGASFPTERMRITSLGALKVSNTGSYLNANSAPHEIRNNADNNNVLVISSAASNGAQYGLSIRTADDQNDTTRDFLECLGGTVVRAKIRSNGGLANYQANDVNLSDRNAKKDISPVTGTWNCIKEWEIVNYRYKDQPDDADLNLGVIAQQVAESCPEVITVFEEAKDDQPEKLGVKEQQMYWMAIKALQEAQSRIETLEAKVAALEAG